MVSSLARLTKVLLAVAFFASSAHAQDQRQYGNDFSAYLGSMLPNQIDGVTEILPVFGGRYAFVYPWGAIELDGANSHAYGIEYTSIDARVRAEFHVADGITGLAYAGPTINWYAPQDQESRQFETGLHAGVGSMALVSDSLWLRADLKFAANPGTSLYLLFGLVFRGSANGN